MPKKIIFQIIFVSLVPILFTMLSRVLDPRFQKGEASSAGNGKKTAKVAANIAAQ